MGNGKFVMGAALCACIALPAGTAAEGVSVDFRYRIESVIDDAFNENALASTLRTRLGYLAPEHHGWQGYIEFADSRVLGFSDYNSTANGKLAYPVIADPHDTELNQAYLERRIGETGAVRVGRQRINLANQRFFGAATFRQLEQTFDAASVQATPWGGQLHLVYVDQVNRVFGAHHPVDALAKTNTRTGIADYERVISGVTAGAYLHLIELPDSPAASHRNTGFRAGARHGVFDWRIEYAKQNEYREGAAVIDADYYRIDVGWNIGNIYLGVLHEVLGGDGEYAFQTPFATLHAFNGATDRFLTTPLNGLVDQALRLRGNSGGWKYGAGWHRFSADAGSARYGRELNFHIEHPLGEHVNVGFKLADYVTETLSTNTRKAWLTLHARY